MSTKIAKFLAFKWYSLYVFDGAFAAQAQRPALACLLKLSSCVEHQQSSPSGNQKSLDDLTTGACKISDHARPVSSVCCIFLCGLVCCSGSALYLNLIQSQ